MQANKIFALLVLSILASILHIQWAVSSISIALILLYAFSEYLLTKQAKSSRDIEQRILHIEDQLRSQSLSKAFK